MVVASIFAPKAIKSPRHAPDRGTHIFLKFSFCLATLYVFSLSQTPKKSKTLEKKTHQSLLILPFSPRTQGIAFALNLPFLGSTLWIWGLGE